MKQLLWTVLLTLPLACANSAQPSAAGSGGRGGGGESDTGTSDAGGAAVTGGGSGSGGSAAGGTGGMASTSGDTNTNGGTTGKGGLAVPGGSTGSGGASANGGSTLAGGTAGSGDAGPRDLPDAPSDSGPDGVRADAADVALSMEVPSPDSVLEAMRRANGFFVGKWPDPTIDIVTDKSRPSNLWTRAVYYEGVMAMYAIEPDSAKKKSLYDYAVRWGESPSHPWTMTYTAASTMTSNADNQCCGQTYIDLYQIDKQPERIATIKANIDDMVSRGITNVWTWIDAIQMSMPVFARLGAITSDARYFDAMWELYNNARTQQGGGLRNPVDGLWWRDRHFTPSGTQQRMTSSLHNSMPGSSTDAYIVSPNGKELYWSRGNGWVMAALVRVLDWLPTGDSHRATYVDDFKTMAASLLPLQRSDGFWNESLLDPTHCASIGQTGQDGPETSGTALFAYGLAWGIRQGLLDSATYVAAVAKAWNGLATIALQADGRLGYVQSTGDRPCTDSAALGPTKLANFDDYGVGAFLLAGSEIYRL